ncbi:MAG TPA: haloacid dehalogenase type II [Burkholderiales bacterium]|nr:haloacid dehalogenase type II [Burkholderiales bacterium]
MDNKVPTRALVFDAYGTLFDVHSISVACESLFPGRGAELSSLWRAKQLEYTWLRSLMGRYTDFESITRNALDYACGALGLELTESDGTDLMQRYRQLSTFSGVRDTLAALRGRKLAILSNGSPAMLNALVEHAGLSEFFAAVISVDELRMFKPHPSVYGLATKHLGVNVDEIGFVSSNFWDVSGAASFGFRTFWINRNDRRRDELGFEPAAMVQRLDQLLPLLNEPVDPTINGR